MKVFRSLVSEFKISWKVQAPIVVFTALQARNPRVVVLQASESHLIETVKDETRRNLGPCD